MLSYALLAKIDKGGFSTVYRARRCGTNGLVALKFHRNDREDDERIAVSFVREVVALHALRRCQGIVRMLDVVTVHHTSCTAVVMEHMQTTLSGFYRSSANDKTKWLPVHFEQIRSALACMHRLSVYHRDIKPSNLLLNRHHNVRVADLNTAKLYVVGRCQTYVPTTLPYAPPEMLAEESYDLSVDAWSLGCTIVELAEGAMLFPPFDHGDDEDNIKAHTALIARRDDWIARVEAVRRLVPEVEELLAPSPGARLSMGHAPRVAAPLTRRTTRIHCESTIDDRARHALVDWLYHIAQVLHISHAAIDATPFNVDEALTMLPVTMATLRTTGCAVLHLTSKVHDVYIPCADDFVKISNGAFSVDELLECEYALLAHLTRFRTSTAGHIDCERAMAWFAESSGRSAADTAARFLLEHTSLFTHKQHAAQLRQKNIAAL